MSKINLPVSDIVFEGIDNKNDTSAKLTFISENGEKSIFDISVESTGIETRFAIAKIFLNHFEGQIRHKIDMLARNGNPIGVDRADYIEINKNGRSVVFSISVNMKPPHTSPIVPSNFTVESSATDYSVAIQQYGDFLDLIKKIVVNYN